MYKNGQEPTVCINGYSVQEKTMYKNGQEQTVCINGYSVQEKTMYKKRQCTRTDKNQQYS